MKRKNGQTEMRRQKMQKILHSAFDGEKVIVYMVDGTIKSVSGKEWLKMDSRLIKHFTFADGNK